MVEVKGYWKDPELKGIYVRRCKCGARPYLDRIAIVPTPWWIKCNCGWWGESGGSKQEAIDNWNAGKVSKENYHQKFDKNIKVI